jgi:hypothetical protein
LRAKGRLKASFLQEIAIRSLSNAVLSGESSPAGLQRRFLASNCVHKAFEGDFSEGTGIARLSNETSGQQLR